MAAPWEFVAYWYRVLQDSDRRKHWMARMERIELAEIMAHSFGEPKNLVGIRREAEAEAAADLPIEDVVNLGRNLAAEIMRAKLVEVC